MALTLKPGDPRIGQIVAETVTWPSVDINGAIYRRGDATTLTIDSNGHFVVIPTMWEGERPILETESAPKLALAIKKD